MSFTSLLTHIITVKRPTATTGVKKTYQGANTYNAFIQPLSDVAEATAGMAFGKAYKCYTDPTADVLEGDQLTDQDGRVYYVKGIKKHNYGSFPHLDMLINEDKRP